MAGSCRQPDKSCHEMRYLKSSIRVSTSLLAFILRPQACSPADQGRAENKHLLKPFYSCSSENHDSINCLEHVLVRYFWIRLEHTNLWQTRNFAGGGRETWASPNCCDDKIHCTAFFEDLDCLFLSVKQDIAWLQSVIIPMISTITLQKTSLQ